MSDWNTAIIEEFRAAGGKVGGPFAGSDLLLLTTTGARTGRESVSPLGYLADGDRLVVTASNAGAPHNPAWYHNVLANPDVTVEVGTRRFHAKATVPTQPERDRLFAQVVEAMPGYGDYQANTTRTIPVVILAPVR
ncbi:nitroreductase family deazaflavin-dependent oxidoreductase [Actinophytocola sp.]|uniref:nitroreductase family deazaflavin-dependent oxidoreductase n=1 Tax=Actinophytocola sp. TaxID=1872138 RepID=UPI002EDB4D32